MENKLKDSPVKALFTNIILAVIIAVLFIDSFFGGMGSSSGPGKIIIYITALAAGTVFSLFVSGIVNFIIYKIMQKNESARVSLFMSALSLFITIILYIILRNS